MGLRGVGRVGKECRVVRLLRGEGVERCEGNGVGEPGVQAEEGDDAGRVGGVDVLGFLLVFEKRAHCAL